MAYRKYKTALAFRIVLLAAGMVLIFFMYQTKNDYLFGGAVVFWLLVVRNLYIFINKRFTEMGDFLESVKYRDFSRWFNESTGPRDMRELYESFNTVIRTVKTMNNEKEVQHIYFQKILEMIDTGIIAYHIDSGEVLLINDSFKDILNVPSFRKINFIEKRKPEVFEEIFEKSHPDTHALSVNIDDEKCNMLISASIFKLDEDVYKIIALQNIDETIDQTESDAWKKLLSVMTHEIMNSIAPISSLAETLKQHVHMASEQPQEHALDMEDLEAGIESIHKRSEGLMMFAKTYRSLHKVTHLNLSTVYIRQLFENIKHLMMPSLSGKAIDLSFQLENTSLQIDIDLYLIEQVLINLILNAMEAIEYREDGKIMISAFENNKGNIIIQVADNGMGIPEEIQDSIFIPFFTTKKNGSGIGLSLSKQIMLLHKGKIQINSRDGKGTSIALIF